MRKFYTLIIPLLFLSRPVTAQQLPDIYSWKQIEKGIVSKMTLNHFTEILENRKQKAIAEKNESDLARCFFLLSQIRDRKTEDSLFWKNSLYIDSIAKDPSSSAFLKSIMHLLKSERIQEYKRKFFYRGNKNLIANYNSGHLFHLLSDEELSRQADRELKIALELTDQLSSFPNEDYFWLSADPLAFLFRPAPTDIIFNNRMMLAKLQYVPKVSDTIPAWLKMRPEIFFDIPLNPRLFSPQQYDIYSIGKEWALRYPSNAESFYFIESLTRKTLFNTIVKNPSIDSAYTTYLQELTESKYHLAKIHAAYQLCLIWNEEGKKYNPAAHDFYRYYYTNRQQPIQEAYRMHYVKAEKLYQSVASSLDSFAFIKTILANMSEGIHASSAGLYLKNVHTPGEPLIATLNYRNIKSFYYRVVDVRNEINTGTNRKLNAKLYAGHSALADSMIRIPDADDLQFHSAYVKLPGQLPGQYIILYSFEPLSVQNQHMEYAEISVSNIAAIHNTKNAFILNRNTGMPVADAAVDLNFAPALKLPARKAKSDNNGAIALPPETSHISVSSGSDDLIEYVSTSRNNYNYNSNIYDPEEFDSRLEYYEENINLHIFTDRAIYRPGQTVYYKGVFTTYDPGTGERVVLNWKNLKIPFFPKLFYKTLVKLSGQKIEINIVDPFNRDVDTIFVMPDKYGAFSGKFDIPKDAATGEWSIEGLDFGNDEENSGTFRVEEYKRPGFEIKLVQPSSQKLPGDSFSVSVKLRSFAGADLNNVRLKYAVNVSGEIEKYISGKTLPRYRYNETIISGEGLSDLNGNFRIVVTDSTLIDVLPSMQKLPNTTYQIEVSATDPTGETHEEELIVSLEEKPVNIQAKIPDIIDLSQWAPLYIATDTKFTGSVSKDVIVELERLDNTVQESQLRTDPSIDTWLYPESQLLPFLKKYLAGNNLNLSETKIFQTVFNTGKKERLIIPDSLLKTGNYRLTMTVKEGKYITGQTTKQFTIFSHSKKEFPGEQSNFHYFNTSASAPASTVEWLFGNTHDEVFSIYEISYYQKTKKGLRPVTTYEYRYEKTGLNAWSFTIPQKVVGSIRFTHLYLKESTIYKKEENFYQAEQQAKPEITVEKFRQKMTPGQEETFTVSIKTVKSDIAAQLMTTMYDASLDKIEEHKWHIPQQPGMPWISNTWDIDINRFSSSTIDPFIKSSTKLDLSVWWSKSDYLQLNEYVEDDGRVIGNMLAGRAAGVSVMETSGLDEVVVVGYGSVSKKSLTGSVSVVIRGSASMASYKNTLVVVDGKIYEGDISGFNTNLITDALMLKGAEVTALYGAKAAEGVLIISTTGDIQLPKENTAPIIRRNFSETAFFLPKIYADKNGMYNIRFTLPESVTEWKWKMMAHTKTALFTYLEKTLVSQKMMMVQPDMPRFLYQGDQVFLKSRISNLDSISIEAKITCTVEDMITGEDLSQQFLNSREQRITIPAKSNATGSFNVHVPENFLHPVKVRIVAGSQSISDGEEHILPILSRKTLVSIQQPIVLASASSVELNIPPLQNADELYGVGLSITPRPAAGMINALPSLAFYPYNCAEQIFNKLFAHAVAIKLSARNPDLQRAEEVNLNKKQDSLSEVLPYELNEQTMPWLRLNNRNSIQQRQLNKLLDTVTGKKEIEKYTALLIKMQKSDGGICWFEGGASNPYISNYILAGFGKLFADSMLNLAKFEKEKDFENFISNLVNYLDQQAIRASEMDIVQYISARNFWTKKHPLPFAAKEIADSVFNNEWKKFETLHLRRAANLITVTKAYTEAGNQYLERADRLLESIKEQAIMDSTTGIRWKEIADADDLNFSSEETVIALAEAFEKSKDAVAIVDGIIQWLLTSKKEHQWSGTKATAAVIGLINRHQPQFSGRTKSLSVNINNRKLETTDDLLDGKPALFMQLNEKSDYNINVRKSTNETTTGALTWYYFTDNPNSLSNSGITINKKLFRYNTSSQHWDPLSAGDSLHVSDRIRVELELNCPKKLTYVFIDDKRAACFEPADALSGYVYGSISYYKSVRDAGFQFFADQIPAGISRIHYEMLAVKTGRFHYGPTALQCMYQPGMASYSGSSMVYVANDTVQ